MIQRILRAAAAMLTLATSASAQVLQFESQWMLSPHLPYCVNEAPGGSIFVTCWKDGQIGGLHSALFEYTPHGSFLREVLAAGGTGTRLPGPVAFFGDQLLVLDGWTGRILRYASDGAFLDSIPVPTDSYDLDLDESGNIYVSHPAGGRVHKFRFDGEPLLSWPVGTPYDLAFRSGILYVASSSPSESRVSRFTRFGQPLGDFLVPRVDGLVGIAVDAYAQIYVSALSNHTVQVLNAQGQWIGAIGGLGAVPGKFREPQGLLLASDGTLFVCDTRNGRIQKFGPGATSALETSWGRLKQLYR